MSDQSHIPLSLRDPERYAQAYAAIIANAHIIEAADGNATEEEVDFFVRNQVPISDAEFSEVWADYLKVYAFRLSIHSWN